MHLPEGFLFGLTGNTILVVSAYVGFSLNKKKNENSSGVFGGIMGATLGNAASDLLGALLDPSLRHAALGITMGCVVAPVVLLPILELYRRKTIKEENT